MTGVTTAWIVQLGIITYRDMKKGATNNIAGLPLPADYLASFAIFGVLGLIPGDAAKVAGVAAWGFVVATFLNLFDPTLAKKTAGSSAVPGPPAATPEGPGNAPVPFLTYIQGSGS